MTTKERVLFMIPLLFSAVLLLSDASGPSGDNTGSPNDSFQNACTQCHSSYTINSGTGSITTNAPATYIPGASYTISVTISQPSPVPGRYGFQAVFLNSSNGQIGTLTGATGVQVGTASTIQHVKHNYIFNSTGTFTFTWTAPSTLGTATMYFAGIAANNNGSSSGDYVYKSSTTIVGVLPFTFTSASTNASCNEACDGSASVNVSTPGTYSYSWSNGNSTNSVSGLCAGNYTVTITNSSGNSLTQSFTITQPTAITNTSTIVGSDCAIANGSISLNASGGAGGYAYSWSNGGSGSSQTGLSAGTYTITITDQSGCSTTSTKVVPQTGSGLSATFLTQNESCNQQNGWAVISMNNGTSPFDFHWNNGSTGDSLLNVSVGTYQVTATDANGCSQVFFTNIGASGVPEISDAIVTNNLCFGNSEGAVDLTVYNGQPPYSYLWSSNANSNSAQANSLENGVYYFTVTDSNGCSSADSAIVSSPDAITANYVIINDWSANTNEGSISLDVTGGVSPYTYLWDDTLSQTTPIASQLEGNRYYSVQISDSNDCQLILDSLFVDMNLGVNHGLARAQFALYPNPTSDWLYVKSQEMISEIDLYDLQGNLWFKSIENIRKVNVSNLPSGIYLIQIRTLTAEENFRITIE